MQTMSYPKATTEATARPETPTTRPELVEGHGAGVFDRPRVPASPSFPRIEERVLAMLVAIVAAVALVLGVSGVHAVVAHTVSERTREFGIRLALGGTPRAVASRVLRGVLLLAGAGVAGGLTIVAALSQLLASRVYGVSPTDPVTLAAMSSVLGIAALAGAWIPARRVLRVNPALTLG